MAVTSLTEQIDTRSPSGELVFHVFGARSLASRLRGRVAATGRPKKLKKLMTIRTLLRSNEVPVQDIAAQLGANQSTLYRNMTAPTN